MEVQLTSPTQLHLLRRTVVFLSVKGLIPMTLKKLPMEMKLQNVKLNQLQTP